MGFIYYSAPSQVALQDSKLPPDPPVRGFPGVWKLPLLRLPSQDRSLSLALLSLFIFYILSYLFSKTMGCFSGCLMTSASDQKLFCEICSAFSYSFDEFVGEKVVSRSCSYTILAPPISFKMYLYCTILCAEVHDELSVSQIEYIFSTGCKVLHVTITLFYQYFPP